jgi:flavin-dependent dehydrogenase
MKRETRIAVIGAGLGGATAAVLLQREGFQVRLFEQARVFERMGAGIHVSANVLKVLRHLEAEHGLSQIGIHPDTFTSRKWDTGEVLFELPLGNTGQQKYGASYITVHRHDLHAAILERVQPGTIEFGKRITDVEFDRAVAHLTFGDGSVADAGPQTHAINAAPLLCVIIRHQLRHSDQTIKFEHGGTDRRRKKRAPWVFGVAVLAEGALLPVSPRRAAMASRSIRR